jgi:pantoate--beta-alanine ligase
MNSRNERLSDEEKQDAAIIYEILKKSKTMFANENVATISNWVKTTFETLPDFELEYFQIADEETLLPCVDKNKNKKYRAFIAVFVNKIRLIDTISLN